MAFWPTDTRMRRPSSRRHSPSPSLRWLVLLWLASAALVAVAVAGAHAQQPATEEGAGASHLRQAGFWPEPVGAGWQAPATPPPEVLGGTVPWEVVALPHSRPRSMAESSDTATALPQVVWYRLQVPAGAAPADGTFLYLPRWQTIGGIAVYADGQLVHRSRGSRVWNSFNRPLWVPLADAQGAPAPATVLVRMASQQGVGGAISTAWVGGEGELLWRYQVRSWLQADFTAMAAGAFVVIGIFAFAVWCVRRSEVMYVLFFATSVTNALRMVQFTMGDVPLPISDDWFGWLTANSLGWSLVCVFLFTVRVHGLRMPRVERTIIALVTAVSVVTLPWLPLKVETVLPVIYLCIVGVTLIVAASGMWASWVNRSPWAMVLSLWVSLTVPASIYDTLMASYRVSIEGLYLGPYASIGVFAIFLVIVFLRYTGALREVETLNAGLESRLAEREAQLAATYAQVNQLERQRALDAERQRMMQDMHDGIGSSLISALRMAEGGRLHEGDMARVLKECIDDLKLSIDSLDHTGADLLSLLAALRFRLGPRLQAAGLTLRWGVQDVPALEWLDPKSALHVLRILQEVLTNIIKHSGAQSIGISTTSDATGVQVLVRDDGQPFSPPTATPPGSPTPGRGKGLGNVRSRVQAIGAQCTWTAGSGAQDGAGAGNVFCLSLPLQQPSWQAPGPA